MTLIEFIRELVGVDRMEMRAAFDKDPQAVLAQYGLGHLTVEDVQDAMVLVRENDMISFDPRYDAGLNPGEDVDDSTVPNHEHNGTGEVGRKDDDSSTAFGDGAIRDVRAENAGTSSLIDGSGRSAVDESRHQTFRVDDAAGTAGSYDQNTAVPADNGSDGHSSHTAVGWHDDSGVPFA